MISVTYHSVKKCRFTINLHIKCLKCCANDQTIGVMSGTFRNSCARSCEYKSIINKGKIIGKVHEKNQAVQIKVEEDCEKKDEETPSKKYII